MAYKPSSLLYNGFTTEQQMSQQEHRCMTETPESQQPAEMTTESTGIAWGDDISPERLAELKDMFDRQQQWAKQPNRDMEQSVFKDVKLTGADVFWLAALALAERENSNLNEAVMRLRLPKASRLRLSRLSSLHLEGSTLEDAQLQDAYLVGAQLRGVLLAETWLQGADLERTNLVDAHLLGAYLQGANLFGAQLQRADLVGAWMKNADLANAQLEYALLLGAQLQGANLRNSSFDKNSGLNDIALDGASLDQVIFDNTNLTVVPWETVHRLGDERKARETKGVAKKSEAFHVAARAYRSLAVALRNQGLGADGTRFHYRSELMERKSLFWHMLAALRSRRFYTAPAYFGRWLFSWLLGTFAGYGDYFGRLLLTYLLVVSVFAGAMFLAANRAVTFDAIRDVFVLSITSFHGRGVQPPGLTMTDTLATLTAVEAFFGLLIEGIFIAAFTRRVTGN
jgi:uncharacterized protein YjbI with pentapeptide repeats